MQNKNQFCTNWIPRIKFYVTNTKWIERMIIQFRIPYDSKDIVYLIWLDLYWLIRDFVIGTKLFAFSNTDWCLIIIPELKHSYLTSTWRIQTDSWRVSSSRALHQIQKANGQFVCTDWYLLRIDNEFKKSKIRIQ